MTRAHTRAPYITGKLRALTAANIAALAAEKLSDPQIARRLEITDGQVRKIREEFGIPAGRPSTRGPAKPRTTKRFHDCPECGGSIRVISGRLRNHHVVRMFTVATATGPVPHAYETDDHCPGSGTDMSGASK